MNNDKFKCLTVYTSPFEKKRYGNPNGDGGYVVCMLPDGYDALLSCGIGGNVSFDDDFLKDHAVAAYAFDNTIKHLPKGAYASDKLQWVNKAVDGVNSDSQTNLIEYIEQYNNIFLKMDIEGSEYNLFDSMLDDIQQQCIQRISQIVVEFHGVSAKDRIKTVEKLLDTHTILHAHANNACVNGHVPLAIPWLLELTFVRNTDILHHYPHFIATANTQRFPHACDVKNIPHLPDIDINHPPFLNVTL
jgi:hypothetical protein